MTNSAWIRLTDSKEVAVGRGSIFRCKGKYPYEDIVDFMLINFPDAPSGHALIVATGYKAGHLLIALPAEASDPKCHGVSVDWLRKNWNHWIYEIGPEAVFLQNHYTIDQSWSSEKE